VATSLEITLAGKIIGQPIQDLYTSGKDLFSNELSKWKNATSHTNLAKKLVKLQKVKTFWQRDREVSLYSFFYPSPVVFNDGVKKEIAGLSQFPTAGNFVIQGTVGQGKSIFLRHLCTQELGEKGSGRIPVFVELRHVKPPGLAPLIYDALDRLGFEINDKLFDFYARSGKLVMLLDGFDEIEESLVAATVEQLERYAEKYENLQIIVTSRPSGAIQNSRHFRIARLAQLGPADHPKFLKKIGLSSSESTKIIEAIASSSAAVSGLLTTPLMMTLLVVVYRAENTIPSELPEFYERLFQTLFSKHDSIKPGLAKRHRTGLGERRLQELFEAFCFSVFQFKKTTTLGPHEFSKCYHQSVKLSGIDCDEESFKHDISRAVCLMQEEGFDTHFIHKSVPEFFSASFIRGLHNEAAQRFYSQMEGSVWNFWGQVLQFLSQIDRYRYAKFFAIPKLTSALSQLGVAGSEIDQIDIDKVMKIAFHGITFNYKLAMDGNVMMQHMTTPNEVNRFLSHIDTFLAQTVFDAAEREEDFERIRLAIGNRKEISLSWNKVLPPENVENVRDRLRNFVSGLAAQLRDLQLFVDTESSLTNMIEI
jgi:hypothetical protein